MKNLFTQMLLRHLYYVFNQVDNGKTLAVRGRSWGVVIGGDMKGIRLLVVVASVLFIIVPGSFAGAPDGMVFVKQGGGGFYMDKTEVTQEAYEREMGVNPSSYKGCPTCPVENVNWYEASEYCDKLGKRLPTEKEWGYAASSGGKDEYAGTSDEGELWRYAWFKGTAYDKTHPVGKKRPNGFGLYDMSGNVWEWTDSWYDDSEEGRVARGGSWNDVASDLGAAFRVFYTPDFRDSNIGFRCSQ